MWEEVALIESIQFLNHCITMALSVRDEPQSITTTSSREWIAAHPPWGLASTAPGKLIQQPFHPHKAGPPAKHLKFLDVASTDLLHFHSTRQNASY